MAREKISILGLKTLEGTEFNFRAEDNCDDIEETHSSFIVTFKEEEYKFRKNEIIVQETIRPLEVM